MASCSSRDLLNSIVDLPLVGNRRHAVEDLPPVPERFTRGNYARAFFPYAVAETTVIHFCTHRKRKRSTFFPPAIIPSARKALAYLESFREWFLNFPIRLKSYPHFFDCVADCLVWDSWF